MAINPAEYQRHDFIRNDSALEVPEDEFVVFGLVYAYPEHADALERIYAETTRNAASEPGTIYYCICRDQDERDKFHFFERYTSRKAFDAHNDQPVIQKIFEENMVQGVKAKFVKAIKPATE